jgi:hypothetical protein
VFWGVLVWGGDDLVQHGGGGKQEAAVPRDLV